MKLSFFPVKKILLVLPIFIVLSFILLQPKTTGEESNVPAYSDTSRDHEGDTFSIVAYDKNTGQVGGAGCSCVPGISGGIVFLSDLITDGTNNPDNIVGAIHSQAAYNASTQTIARNRMLAGDTPQQIIDATVAADGGSASRQYGVVGVDNPGAAGFTGSSNSSYANDIQYDDANFTISIQGNILDTSANGGQDDILEDMREAFLNAEGTLADRLMAALQGAKRVGGDNRCYSTGTNNRGSSGTTAFVQVLSPGETSPSISYNTGNAVSALVEPIDVLQCLYDNGESTPFCRQTINTFPYTMDFETKSWEQETATCSTNSSWIRSRHATPSANTGPASSNQDDLYIYVESSNVGGQGTGNQRRAILGSPCLVLPFNNTIEMTFDYHMLGTDMGTLSVEVSDDNGATWNTEWSQSGNQGANWQNNETIDLTAYQGSTIKIRLNALLGGGFTSDMAVDDIRITATPGITCNETNTFSGGSWSLGRTPNIRTNAIIDANYNTSTFGSIDACQITINTGRTLTISSDEYASIANDIIVNGTLIVEHQGSVVQIDEEAVVTKGGSGIINVELTTPILNPKDFMLIGSPMSDETRENLFISDYKVMESHPENFIPDDNVPAAFGINFADDNRDNWTNYPTGSIIEGNAYLFRPENDETQPASSYDITFSQGTLNNGDFSIPVTYNGATINPAGTLNMIANPYPSAISVIEFLEQNPSVNEIYFWEHITTPNGSIPGAYTLNYSMEDISRRNISAGSAAGNDGSGTTAPGENIASAQGFMVIVTDNTPIVFNNTMRVTSGNNTLRTEDENLINQIGLRVTDARDFVGGNAVLAFNPKATSEYDPGYDSKSIATIVSLFTLDGTSDTANAYGIQTIEPFNDSMEIPLGFATQINENHDYTISLNSLEGLAISQTEILLRDNYNGTTVNLNNQDYQFSSTRGNFNDRFTILFKGQTVLGTQEQTIKEVISVFPNPASDYITINTRDTAIKSIQVYDIQGRLVKNVEDISNTTEQTINLQGLKNSMYLVKINTENGASFTKRIIKK